MRETQLREAARLLAAGHGDRFIAGHLGITRHAARNLIRAAEKSNGGSTALAVIDPDPKTPDEYAARITACWRKSAEDFIEAGRWLIRAKNELDHGQFGDMIEASLPFGASTAQRLMIVAADPWITNPAHVQHLPPHWGTLYEISKLDETQRDEMVAAGTISPAMERRAIATIVKQERRTERERVLGGKILALPDKRYGVILADPEWRYDPWSRDTGMDRSADNHYPTSCTEVIAARDVPSIAAANSILFLCATVPMLPHGLLVMAAWGFDYVSNYVLEKDRIITGHWNRNRHERLLIGVRGHVTCPAPGTQWDSLIASPVGEHSAKSDAIARMIEQYFPTLPKIELNRRGPARKGWDAWGDEAQPYDGVAHAAGMFAEPNELVDGLPMTESDAA